MAYWDFKIKGEFDKSYEYEDPFFRKKVSLVNYIRGFNPGTAKWTAARVENVAISDGEAEAAMKVKLQISATPSRTVEPEVPLKEKWIKSDHTWYHVPQ